MRFPFANKKRKKVPTVLQMEATECGAAALGMVLAYYGLWVPLEKLRAECGVNRDGSKASCVVRAARNRGCEADGYGCPPRFVFLEIAYNLLHGTAPSPTLHYSECHSAKSAHFI